MASNAAKRSSNIKAVGLPNDKDRYTSFLWSEELSQLSDLFCLQTGTGWLIYGH